MNIYVASGHRTGSSHIAAALADLFGFQHNSMMPVMPGGNGSDEHMVHPFVAQCLLSLNRFVFQQHAKATRGNLNLLKSYNVRPIVCIRNIFDSMVSVKEKMDNAIYVPCVPSPIPWMDTPEEQRWRWLAYAVAAWNLGFYASWHYADIAKLIVRYEEFYADQLAGMKRILHHLGRDYVFSDRQIRKVLKTKDPSFNKGVSGRGEAVPDFARRIVLDQMYAWGETGKHMREDLT